MIGGVPPLSLCMFPRLYITQIGLFMSDDHCMVPFPNKCYKLYMDIVPQTRATSNLHMDI